MRGLKSLRTNSEISPSEVALYTSAWIEIVRLDMVNQRIDVALYMSAWIEIDAFGLNATSITVALYTSAWIEIKHYECQIRIRYPSHSTRVRGLKLGIT